MTIRRQFHLLLAAIIVIPLLCASFIPIYHYLMSPERVLMHGYREIRSTDELQLSENDWNKLYDQLRHLPPDMEVALITFSGRSTVLLSSMPELKVGISITQDYLWHLIGTTSSKYFYQFSSPNFNDTVSDFLILSRAKRDVKYRRKNFNFVLYLVFFILSFSGITIFAIAHISHTIFSSITILEQKTQRIADGDLSISLKDDPKKIKQKSNEIISLTENLDKMRRSLLDSQERRTRFIMGISHDLRTPVAVIKGYTEAISDDVVTDPDEIKKSLEIITTKTNQLEGMIDTLINFVKLDNADWRQDLIPVSVRTVVEEFAKGAVMTGTVFKRKVSNFIDISPELKIPMDKQLFSRALENIFSNAIRYSKEGDSIVITGTETEKSCIISIRDTGIGIAKKDKDHIFDMFYRGTNSRREEGMGIGLTVVKSIIDTHGWTIDVQSELGKGTEFIITIPKKKEKITS
ncbi:MAG: HAMP domain-containing sensor histidine kinase [Treponema sp.]